MATLNPYPGDDHFPYSLRAAEADAIRARRKVNNLEPSAPAVGVALSGGGIRSATFCLGVFQALARQRFIRRIDLLSSVSGGGYFASFLGTSFVRDNATPDEVERELAENHSWSVRWLRENGRFLSPNGAGDNWLTAAVALRNWIALHIVLLSSTFLMLGLGALIRADLWTGRYTSGIWTAIEEFFWVHNAFGIWWSPWMVLPVIPVVLLMTPTGTVYWLTQWMPLMGALRRMVGVFSREFRTMTSHEFRGRAQHHLTRVYMIGFVLAVTLLGFAVIDSIGQTVYYNWSEGTYPDREPFEFPTLWAMLTGGGAALFGFGSKIAVYLEKILGRQKLEIPSSVMALIFALGWSLLIVLGLSVAALGFAWNWAPVRDGVVVVPMTGGWPLMLAVSICFVASWFFSRAFGFVNLSSMQQIYAARLSRAYLGATNPERRAHENHSMTDLLAGDDIRIEDYSPHLRGGPLHLINVTVNETISGKTNIERCDRKGVAMAVGPCGMSVGIDSHALWAGEPPKPRGLARLQMLWDTRHRSISPISCSPDGGRFHALCSTNRKGQLPQQQPLHHIEALPLGRWVAISGAAFTTGTGSNTSLGLSLLLGLGNIRLGYWWDSGIDPNKSGARAKRPTFLELASRVISRVLPVQSCLMNEFFARFHGAARRHWYLSDGGHFENTGCYELIRRRVPFMICTDGGQDPNYQFGDLANLVRKARIDFNAEIQIVRRREDVSHDDPGVKYPMPCLEDILHPNMLDIIGTPDDFAPLAKAGDEDEAEAVPKSRGRNARCHALLARIQYLDNDQFSWLLIIKPSIMGDEAADVIQYQRTHPMFPQEPTSDQYFDEAQWESYRKLGEHIGTELFTPPLGANSETSANWSPSKMAAPKPPPSGNFPYNPENTIAEIRELPGRSLAGRERD